MAQYSPFLITPPFILTFPYIWKPRATDNGGYEVCALFTEPTLESEAWKEMVAAVQEIGKAEFGSAFNADFIKKLRENKRFAIRDAAEKAGEWGGFEPGRKYINMKRSAEDGRPDVVDMRNDPVLDESSIYAGVVCRAGVKFRAYDNKWGQGVSCYFEHLQLIKTGTPRLDNRQSAKQVFSKADNPSDMAGEVLKDMGIDTSSVSSDADDVDI
jgi:hypothetical protein